MHTLTVSSASDGSANLTATSRPSTDAPISQRSDTHAHTRTLSTAERRLDYLLPKIAGQITVNSQKILEKKLW